ncbi:hypothetical protein ACWDWU_49250, partial [Streptomyces sp. NPDC003442]
MSLKSGKSLCHVPGRISVRRLVRAIARRRNLAGHPRHLVGERGELVDHGVDRRLELEDLAL